MAMALLCLVVASCKDQKDIYQEWVKKGGYIYPEKANDLGFMRGYNRMLLQWQYPKDPSVTHATVYWTNRTDSLNIDYKDYAGKDTVNLVIDGLTERAYTFEVVNYDRDGNTSMVSEITATPYAENWLATHAEREIFSAEIVGDHALIQTGFGTDEMVKTQYRYVNAEGDTIYLDKPQDTKTASVELPGAAPGRPTASTPFGTPGAALLRPLPESSILKVGLPLPLPVSPWELTQRRTSSTAIMTSSMPGGRTTRPILRLWSSTPIRIAI